MLAGHPRIASFPQSHFFIDLVPWSPWRRALGIASRPCRPRFQRFLEQVGARSHATKPWESAWLVRTRTAGFLRLLDDLALQQGKDEWVEKTPDHLRALATIEMYVPGARFIHLVRSGKDVVASLYDVTHRFPESWGGSWSIERCVEKWNEDIQLSRAQLGKPNHFHMQYEKLVASPRSVLNSLCSFLDVPFDEAMVLEYHHAARGLATSEEHWMHGPQQALHPGGVGRFERTFDARAQRYVLDHLDAARDLLDDLPCQPLPASQP
jgi:hypothetical protein